MKLKFGESFIRPLLTVHGQVRLSVYAEENGKLFYQTLTRNCSDLMGRGVTAGDRLPGRSDQRR
jgi:hypothetical protein